MSDEINTEPQSNGLPPASCSADSERILSQVFHWIERNHPDGFIDSLSYSENLDRCRDHAERYTELHGDVARAAMRLLVALDRYIDSGRWDEIKNAMPRLRAALPSMFEERSGQRSRAFHE